MVINTEIEFIREFEGDYNETTGDYDEPKKSRDVKLANVTGMGTNKMHLVFGRLQQGALTIRLYGRYEEPFDYIRVNGKDYNVGLEKINPKFTVYEVVERA